jgi:hypothetical protein
MGIGNGLEQEQDQCWELGLADPCRPKPTPPQAILTRYGRSPAWKPWPPFLVSLFQPSRRTGVPKAGFFADIQELCWHYLIVNICRLTDPPEQGRHQNLVLSQLPAHLSPLDDAPLIARLNALLAAVETALVPLRPWRHKHIAHSDLPTQLSPISPLPGLSDKSLQTAIDAVTAVMNEFNRATTKKLCLYSEINDLAGAETLVDCLKLAQEYRRLSDEDPAYRERFRENKNREA